MSLPETFDPSTMMELTCRAVSLLMQGRYEESQALLHVALRNLMSVASPEVTNERPQAFMAGESLYFESFIIPFNNATGTSSEAFDVFNRALVIRPGGNPAAAIAGCPHLLERLATVLLYNLALSLHLRALETGSSKNLRMALHIYQRAMALLVNVNTGAVDDDSIVALALLNNMGHIHEASFSCHKEASTCLSLLRQIFEGIDSSHALRDDESLFFYLTLFLYPSYQKGMAAAA
ncbi:unknown protein [Seminavis robusta]|uniref:Uncharacterized protein n=1 Tax=Seminavis robusta TaxID=568900 RepID=A0A9N8H881_9STRA|nr:expressed unknown protein [Seminavis robusta]CAB9529514.1 unknown protein [Seminavis robusta]|eukprot:Sro2527_g330310.1 n/a (235) ;mRNA; f:9633-10337